MKPKSILLISTFLMARAIANDVVYQENFEDDTIATAPLIGVSNVGDSYAAGVGTILVNANPEALGNTSAQVLGATSTGPTGNNIVAQFAGGAQPVDGMTVQYDFYGTAGNNTNDGVRFALVGNDNSMRDVFIRNDADTLIKLDGTDQTEVNFGKDVWQRFDGTFTTTGTAGEFTLAWTITNLETSTTVSNSQTVTINVANFTDEKARGVLIEVFEGNAAANDFSGYIDNITVTADTVIAPTPPAIIGFSATTITSGGTVRLHWNATAGTPLDPVTVTLSDGTNSFPTGNQLSGFVDVTPDPSATGFTLTASNATGSPSTTTPLPAPANAFSTAVLADNPSAYFRFNEQSDSLLLADSSGAATPHDAIITGSARAGVTGSLDGSFNLDNASSARSDLIFNPGTLTNGLTIETIVKRLPDAAGGNLTLVSQADLNGTGRLYLSCTNDGLVSSFMGGGNTGNRQTADDGTMLSNTWQHLVIVADLRATDPPTVPASQVGLRWYLDGALIGETAASAAADVLDFLIESTQGDWVIGSNKFQGGEFWKGPLDELAIYDYMLDDPNADGDRADTKISTHYSAWYGETSGLLGFATLTDDILAGEQAALLVKVGPDVLPGDISVDNGAPAVVTITDGVATILVSPTTTTTYTVTVGSQTEQVTIIVTQPPTPPAITSISRAANGDITLIYTGPPSATFELRASTDLMDFSTNLGQVFTDGSGNGTITFPSLLTNPKEFYRLQSIP